MVSCNKVKTKPIENANDSATQALNGLEIQNLGSGISSVARDVYGGAKAPQLPADSA
jgi:hypothetical protein